MDNVDRTDPSEPTPGRSGAPWFLLACSAAAAVVALVPCAGLLAQRSPTWVVVAAGLAVFPFLPLLWHGLAEARATTHGVASRPGARFALRALAVALLVLAVSFGDLGPSGVVRNVRDLIGHVYPGFAAKPAPPPTPVVPLTPAVPNGLEPFIPADATLVVGLAGSAAMEQLLAAHGVDTREKLAALATCKIDFVNARVLIATRGSGTRMIVLRAQGITDERNLYCLVGVMGRDRLQFHTDGTGPSKTLYVSGLLSHPLTFRLLDPTTIIATDESWQDTAGQKLFSAEGATPQGRLALPLSRIDRSASVWAASVDETSQGTWDLALDSHQEGSTFKLQGSSTPPSGEADRAQFSVRVPLAFARALPESAVALGIRGVVTAVVATGASLSPPKALPAGPAAPGAPATVAPKSGGTP
jgi:hypothetical protein